MGAILAVGGFFESSHFETRQNGGVAYSRNSHAPLPNLKHLNPSVNYEFLKILGRFSILLVGGAIMVYQLKADASTFENLKEIKLETVEGVLYAKFVLLKQNTLSSGNAASVVEAAPAVILMGDLEQVKTQLIEFFDQAIKAYNK